MDCVDASTIIFERGRHVLGITEWFNKVVQGDKCAIDEYFDRLENKMNSLLTRCDRIEDKLDNDIKELSEELEFYKGFVGSIAETLPDMMWCKDSEGKYLYANQAIKDGLLFDDHPEGKTDVWLATRAKARFGEDNHTFGEKCSNSDKAVLDKVRNGTFTEDDGRFLESGKIKGKMKYLEVFKAPLFVKGKLIGVVGTGRDMTDYVEAYREHSCDKCGKMMDIFSKYEFEG